MVGEDLKRYGRQPFNKESEITKMKIDANSAHNDGWTIELAKKRLAELESFSS